MRHTELPGVGPAEGSEIDWGIGASLLSGEAEEDGPV